MAGTRWKETARRCAGMLLREARITLTPLTRPTRWAFIVGCYNSGTTLLESLLGAHPEVAPLPFEGQFLTDQFQADYELGLPRMWVLREDLFRLTEEDEGPDVARIKKEWAMRLDRSRPTFLEKSPPNTARTRWLQHHFEDAHFIAIVRNGYAVAEGIRRKAEPRHLAGGWPIDLCARQWARSYEVLLEDLPRLDRLIWVRYEDLATDPAAELRRMTEFLQLQTVDADVKLNRRWTVHERSQRIQNLNAESIERLTDEDIRRITEAARPMLERFDYELLE